VLWATCHQLQQWHRQFPDQPLYASVNVASQQLQQSDFLNTIDQVLAGTALDPAFLHLEITERALIEDTAHTAEVLAGLRQLGIQINLDDFGTGFSSLSYLHRFPVDVLKIDQSFVGQIQPDHPQAEALGIIRAILNLAQGMGMHVVAEGVETDYQRQQLAPLARDTILPAPCPSRLSPNT
jgi:EAL domain-containing protein (putative c-di-GMP-specific phosphodiesterase class I)